MVIVKMNISNLKHGFSSTESKSLQKQVARLLIDSKDLLVGY